MENQKEEENVENWSEAVEDLVAAGDTDGAISLLETRVSNLQSLSSSNPAVLLQLASALGDLASLYSSKRFSLKADDLRSRASLLKHQALSRYPFLSLSFLLFLCSENWSLCLVAEKMWDAKGGIWNFEFLRRLIFDVWVINGVKNRILIFWEFFFIRNKTEGVLAKFSSSLLWKKRPKITSNK